MGFVRLCLQNPVGVVIAVALVAILGLISLTKLPVQLFPDIERPQIAIETGLRAASPEQVEAEIVEPQEEVLRGIPGLKEIVAFANPGGSWVGLTFDMKTDMTRVLQEVTSRLNRTPALPPDAMQPRIIFSGEDDSNASLIFFFIQTLPGNEKPILDYMRYVEDTVIPRFEAIEGVARVSMESGRPSDEELLITVDPLRAAEQGLSILDIAAQIGETKDVSAGWQVVGRRAMSLSIASGYSPAELTNQVITWRDGRPVRLGDVASVEVKRSRQWNFAFQNGNPAIGLRILRESGANVLSTLRDVKAAADDLKVGMAEKGLTIEKSFDPSIFIERAIGLLTSNLITGTLLSLGIVWLFLRNTRATILIGMGIPICLLAMFLVLFLTGRTLNVISLAGLAFAIGMVLDTAIVVLENILRLRHEGATPETAAERGAGEVFGALIASTVTMVAIFVPVVFMRDVEGQLFADLALTISIGIVGSLIVSVTILPVAARHWLPRMGDLEADAGPIWQRLTNAIMWTTDTPKRRLFWIGGLMVVSISLTVLLRPELNYLPPIKRDAVDSFIGYPPGTDVTTVREEIAPVILERLMPYMRCEKEPCLLNFYFIGWPGGSSLGVRVIDVSEIRTLERLVRDEILAGLPDTFSFTSIGNLFGGFGDEGSIAINLQSADADALRLAALRGQEILNAAIPGANVQVEPYPELTDPQIQFEPKDDRLSEVGWTRADLIRVLTANGSGLWLGDYFDGQKNLDTIVKAPDWTSPEELLARPVVTPSGALVPLGDLVTVRYAVGQANIRRVDGRRTFTLRVVPPETMALAPALQIIQDKVEPQLQAMLPADARISYGGSADSLKRAVGLIGQNFLFAVLILTLILAGLYRSLTDALFVIVTIPLATVGGILALRLLGLFTFQPLDLLTAIGFIILLGLVVNNAVLLVDQTRQGQVAGLDRREAVERAVAMRLKPILMGSFTTVAGMLPMVVFPGPGSVIYRGLGAVIVGGMAISTLFTLILLPSLLRMGEGLRAPARGGLSLRAAATSAKEIS